MHIGSKHLSLSTDIKFIPKIALHPWSAAAHGPHYIVASNNVVTFIKPSDPHFRSIFE